MPMNFLAFDIVESSAIIGLSAVRLAQLHVKKKNKLYFNDLFPWFSYNFRKSQKCDIRRDLGHLIKLHCLKQFGSKICLKHCLTQGHTANKQKQKSPGFLSFSFICSVGHWPAQSQRHSQIYYVKNNWCFLFYFNFFIGVQLIYKIVSISIVEQSDSVIYILSFSYYIILQNISAFKKE